MGDIVRDKKNTKVKPPIFLALQGGGAKGIVHIGGVTALNDLEFEFRGISGTSAGSIVAALLAVGYSPQELFDLDGSGNLFEKLPSKLVKKPTDLFPFWGWITLRTARGLGCGCQAAFSPFSRLMSAISERWVTLFKDSPAPNGSMLRRLWHKSKTTTKKLVRKGWAWTKPLVYGLGFSYLVIVFAQYVTPTLKLLPDAQLTMLVA